MKYVMFKGDTFVIIPDGMAHSDCDNVGIAISAGSCSIEQCRNEYDDIRYKVQCWGSSHSLKLKSRKEDSEIMSNYLI